MIEDPQRLLRFSDFKREYDSGISKVKSMYSHHSSRSADSEKSSAKVEFIKSAHERLVMQIRLSDQDY